MTLLEAIVFLFFLILFGWLFARLFWLLFTNLDVIWASSLQAAKSTGEHFRDLFFHGGAR